MGRVEGGTRRGHVHARQIQSGGHQSPKRSPIGGNSGGGPSAEEPSDSPVLLEPEFLDPTTRMCQWLRYLGVLRGLRSYLLDGKY